MAQHPEAVVSPKRLHTQFILNRQASVSSQIEGIWGSVDLADFPAGVFAFRHS